MNQLLEEVEDHQKKSKSYLDEYREKWKDYESMVICSHREAMQNKNKVYDPRLGTIELERTARIMAQRPTGEARPISTDDIGKSQLMNMLLGHQMDNANEQFSFLIKLRMLSFWSRVYGSLFALVPWRVSDKYIGPELNILSIWDSFPQPNVQPRDADWFVQQHWLSIKWLLEQDPEVWDMNEIKSLAGELKREKDEGDVKHAGDEMGEIEQELTPSQFGDAAFPKVKAYTEYRKDKWVTWTPQRANSKLSRPRILRVVKREDSMLPIVCKQFIPSMIGPIGIGPFQRGKSLQFATNQVINMHLSGIKSSLAPELMINPNNVVPSSVKYGAAEKWFMNNPGKDVVSVQKSGEAVNVFNSTYGMLISSMLNQGGTTDTTSSNYTETSLGKTPQALRIQAAAQAAMDEWEEVMLHDAIKEVMVRWMDLNSKELDTGVMVRLFGKEIEKLIEKYPDTQALVEGGNGVFIDKTVFQEDGEPISWDYDMEVGATSRPNMTQEKDDINELIKFVLEAPQLLEYMRNEGKAVNVSELFERSLSKTGIKDIDKIVVDAQAEQTMNPQMGQIPQMGQMEPQMDMMGGINGIPQV
jgi:hypothetical protein